MNLRDILARPECRLARASIVQREAATLEEQLRIVRIPAPSLQEERRAAYLHDRFREIGLDACRTDEVGNVLGRLPGSVDGETAHAANNPAAAPVVVAAHLDTVFGPDTEIEPRVEGSRVYAPGITDNARGVAAMIALAEAIRSADVVTRRPIWFVGTVGEEGVGDLRGAKHLLRSGGPTGRPAAFIALDGSGVRRIVHRAVGARRLRVEITGPGGHSWSDWGTPNPLHVLGRCIDRLSSLPQSTRTPLTLTVARAGGGTSVNAIPGAAWFEVDIRSEHQAAIASVERSSRQVLEEEVARANETRRGGTAPLTLAVRVIGDRPSGTIPETAPLVAAAVAATRLVGVVPELVASSTDANVPLSLGIPAVTLGAGGDSGGIHTLEEWFCGRGGAVGLERALLTVLAAAGVA